MTRLNIVLLSVPVPLCSACLEILKPNGGMLSPAHMTMTSLSMKLRLPLGHFVLLIPVNHHEKKEIIVIPLLLCGVYLPRPPVDA